MFTMEVEYCIVIHDEQLVQGGDGSPEPATPDAGSSVGLPASHARSLARQSLSPQSLVGAVGGGGQMVELASPLVLREEDLDANHDEDAPLWFRTMDNIIGPVSPHGLAPRALLHELHVVSSDEPTSFTNGIHAGEEPCLKR
jgi:hypothetical protein